MTYWRRSRDFFTYLEYHPLQRNRRDPPPVRNHRETRVNAKAPAVRRRVGASSRCLRLEPRGKRTGASHNPPPERRAMGSQTLSEFRIPLQFRELSELPTDESATIFTTAESRVRPVKPVSFFNQNQPLLSTIANLFYFALWRLPAGLVRGSRSGADEQA